ncbi:MAG: hypothetical protein AB7O62_19410 [Pirellulales bacterium]
MTRFVLSLMLLSTLWASTRASHADETQDAIVKSYELEKSAGYAEAIAALKEIRKPTYLVELRLGWLSYLSGKYNYARQHYQAAMKQAPKSIEPRLGLTLPLLAELKYAEVESVARSILKIDNSNYTASIRLAMALRLQGKLKPAREVNRDMLELYPTDASFLVEQLLTSVGLKETDVPDLALRILAVDPENATAKFYAPPARNGAVPTARRR